MDRKPETLPSITDFTRRKIRPKLPTTKFEICKDFVRTYIYNAQDAYLLLARNGDAGPGWVSYLEKRHVLH